MKDAYYFSHDVNARHDPKILAMRSDFDIQGYGIYWIIIEMMSEQEGYKLKRTKWLANAIAMELHSNAMANDSTSIVENFLERCVNDYELFTEQDGYIWSESLLRRMTLKEEKRNKKIEAGKKGAEKRWNTNVSDSEPMGNDGTAIANDGTLIANDGKGKEIKLKESKVNEPIDALDSAFEEFYSAYPRKRDRKRALERFKAAAKKHGTEIIIEGTKKYVQECEIKGTEPKYIKHPATFLNQESFLNDFDLKGEPNGKDYAAQAFAIENGIPF